MRAQLSAPLDSHYFHFKIATCHLASTPRYSAGQFTSCGDGPSEGAAVGDEVAIRVHGCFPLPMNIEREDRCERTGGSTDLEGVHGSINVVGLIWSGPSCKIAQVSA